MSTRPRLTLLLARARNGVIGRAGTMPWRLPEDLAYFKRTTMGHPIVMGRKTWDSIGRPLPGRRSIVVTSNRVVQDWGKYLGDNTMSTTILDRLMHRSALLEFEGKTLGPFNVRYKGNSWSAPCTTGGRDDPKDGKCSMKLDFDKPDSNVRFYGVKKLNFHSMNNDPSMLRDRLGYALFREMGIATPRTAHARLLVNGKLEGLYIAVEQIDGVFARSRFREGGLGNVYKEIWPMHDAAATYVAALETNATQPNVQHMLDFRAAIAQSRAAAERFYDRDYMLRYLAVDRVTMNDDGVVRFLCVMGLTGNNPGPFGNHNYYWYEETQSGRMWLIPWDLDKSFLVTTDVLVYPKWTDAAACSCTGNAAYGSQMPTSCDPLFQHIQSTIADYESAVDAFIAGPFAKSHVDQLIDDWAAQIRPHVQATAGQNGAETLAQWETGVADLKRMADDARVDRGYHY